MEDVTFGLLSTLAIAIVLLIYARMRRRYGKPKAGVTHNPGASVSRPDTYLARWKVSYCDFDGVITERIIRIVEVQPRLEKLHVWCELRQDRRTFNLHGLRDIEDAETGLPVDISQWFQGYNRSRRKKT
jgi:hypothetical protein